MPDTEQQGTALLHIFLPRGIVDIRDPKSAAICPDDGIKEIQKMLRFDNSAGVDGQGESPVGSEVGSQ
jgi:hypothetical protein